MNKKIVLIFKLLITSVLLIIIFGKIPFYNILKTFSSVNLILFFLAFLLTIPVILLSSYQTKYLTSIQKIQISFKEILKIYLTTGFYSLFLPGDLAGGAVKWYKFKKHGTGSSAAAVVIFNRFLELLVVIFLGILFSIPGLINSGYRQLLIIWIITLILLSTSYIILLNTETLKKTGRILNKFPIPISIKNKIENLLTAIYEFRNLTLKDHCEIFGIMFLYHILNVAAFYLIAESINVSVSFFVLGWVRSVVIISNFLPISYSGLGVREGIIIYLLSYYGVPSSEALVISLLSFTKNLFVPLAGGIIELKDFLLSKNYKSLERSDKPPCVPPI